MPISDQLASVPKLYGETWVTTDPAFEADLARPRPSRSPEALFEHAASLGLGADARVLDIGTRDAVTSARLTGRFSPRLVTLSAAKGRRTKRRQRAAATRWTLAPGLDP